MLAHLKNVFLVSVTASLAFACASTTEPSPAVSDVDVDVDVDVEQPDAPQGEEEIGQTSQALCAVTCSARQGYPGTYVYYCSGPCNGNSFYKVFSTWRGYSFCYSRHAC